jgi:multidrug resistance efflux pump
VVTVEVQAARIGALSVDNTAAGAIQPDTQSSVAAGSSGTVKSLLKKAGDWVEAGTPVIQLDDAQLKLALRLAQATLENAKINAGVSSGGGATGATSKLGLQIQSAQSSLSSAEKNWASAQALNKIQGISGSDYDNAQVQLQTAQANLESAKMALQQNGLQVETASIQVEQAQLNVANATIKAPYAGQISVMNVHPGEYVGQSTAVFGLVSREKVISFSVSPSEAPGLNIGTPVKFTYNGNQASTRVTQIPAAPVGGLVNLTAALPASFNASLGTVGTISYSVVLAHGTLVPLAALQSAENKTYVYTSENNKAARFEVEILAESGSEVAITGLKGTPLVVLNPPPGLLVGAALQGVPSADAPATNKAGAAAGGPAGSAATGQRQRGTGTGGTGKAPAAGDGQAPLDPNAAPGASGFTGQRRRPQAGGATTPAGPAADPAAGPAPTTTGGQ